MAKLVEILAKELKEWPGDWPALGQACDGSLHREPFLGGHTSEFCLTRANDYTAAIVTRSGWQAAVDALRAKDIASSTAAMIDAGWIDPRPPVSPSLHAQAVGRANRIPEWDGVGLPPVGSTVELVMEKTVQFEDYDHGIHCIVDTWESGDQLEVIAHRDVNGKPSAIVFNARTMQASAVTRKLYRPIRTPEQIAEEEREKQISGICLIFGRDPNSPTNRNHAARLYDAGYRKQEAK